MQSFLLIATVVLLPLAIRAEYTKLEWTDCGSRNVEFYSIDLKPMPILQPGQLTINAKANFKKALRGNLKTLIDIKRTVAGLTIPIRCYLAAGVYVGSCTYDDLCKVVETLLPDAFNPTACIPSLAVFGIDCTCPFKIGAGLINMDNIELELPDAAATVATFLASGDFDIKIDGSDADGKFGCIQVKFTVKPSKPGK